MSEKEIKVHQKNNQIKNTLDTFCKKFNSLGFDREIKLHCDDESEAAATVWGQYQGIETPRIFLLVLAKGNWQKVNTNYVQERSYTLNSKDTLGDEYPQFAIVADEQHEKMFDLKHHPYEIDHLPTIEEINEYEKIIADPTYRWSIKMFNRLVEGFDGFYKQFHQNASANISSSNDIVREVIKILFLESFRLLHEGSDLEFKYQEQTLPLDKVFTPEYVRKYGYEAVAQIQAAFDFFKSHPNFLVTDHLKVSHAIFNAQTHLELVQPRDYETLLDLIHNLGIVTNNQEKVVKLRGTLADISSDVLGRALDVFLRRRFKHEQIGSYLTPAPVKQAMLGIAFHDIKEETPELLTARGADGKPDFRFCDPACGSYGFGSVALSYIERSLQEILGKETTDYVQRDKLFADMCQNSFIGADYSQDMVTFARVRMALLGVPKAKIFHTNDSLTTEQLQPCSYDLICTNPPFGRLNFIDNKIKDKKAYEKSKELVLEKFRSDLKLIESSKKILYDYEPSIAGLALGGKPDSKGFWRPAKHSIDYSVLFIDRCLQLLKPGGRLLIIVPDGVLSHSSDRYVREYIMGKKDEVSGEFNGGKAIVKAVISLPVDTFKLSGKLIKTSILYLQKRKARGDNSNKFNDEPQSSIFMAVADTLGYLVKNDMEDYSSGVSNDLVAIVDAYARGE